MTPIQEEAGHHEEQAMHPDDVLERLVIAVKRKLLIFYFDGAELVERKVREMKFHCLSLNINITRKDLNLYDKPRAVTWADANTIIATLPKGQIVLNVTTGTSSDLLSKDQATPTTTSLGISSLTSPIVGQIGRSDKSPIIKLKDGHLVVTRDDFTFTVLPDGKISAKSDILWSSTPSELVYAPPYLVALLPHHVEVRSLRSKEAVQLVKLPNAKILLDEVYTGILVASSTSIWRLLPLDFEDQIEQLLSLSQFAEAQRLIEDLEFPSEDDRTANIIRVKGMHAHHLFTYEKKYREAVKMLEELKGSPLDVINLYPEFNEEYFDHSAPPAPSERAALQVLMDYLTSQRAILAGICKEYEAMGFTVPPSFSISNFLAASSSNPPTQSGTRSGGSVFSGSKYRFYDQQIRAQIGEEYEEDYDLFLETLYLARVVDTTLLKVYLSVNDALVSIFLRVPNVCELDESEALLLDRKKYSELIDLYRGKGLHRRALQFMVDNEAIIPKPIPSLVSYIQRLPPTEMDMILEYSDFVIRKDPVNGIKIFTEEFDEISTETRKRIADFLDRISNDLTSEYLMHVILNLHEEDPELNERLIINYAAKIISIAEKAGSGWIAALGGAVPNKKEDGESEIISLRRVLLSFLETSQAYDSNIVLPLFPEEGLYEERCILLSRLNRHDEALYIFIFKLHRYDLAESYCQRHYVRGDPHSGAIFTIILQYFMELVTKAKTMSIDYVLQFMARNGPNMDVVDSIQLLPDEVRITKLTEFFEKSLHNLHRTRNIDEIVKNLLLAERLQVQEKLIFEQSKSVRITEDKMCAKCLKRIANSVFAWFPDGKVVHVYCVKK
ncbi:Vam6/Vps39-like protein [Nowakowskiella sp. JEL0407]|nr:Vam6/Vps39-like protein [Nowakowskiella sp. JEL0407]